MAGGRGQDANGGWETKGEMLIRRALEKAGIRFEQECSVGGYRADFRVGQRILIEVDGYVHYVQSVSDKDARKEAYLEQLGYTILHITNMDAKSPHKLRQFVTRLKEEIERECSGMMKGALTHNPFDLPSLSSLKEALESRDASRGSLGACSAQQKRLTGAPLKGQSRPPRRRLSDSELFRQAVEAIGDVPEDR